MSADDTLTTQQDHAAKILELQARVGPRYTIAKPTRTKILYEGVLFQHVPESKLPMTANVREAFLFPDALVLLKQESKSQLSVAEIPLNMAKIKDRTYLSGLGDHSAALTMEIITSGAPVLLAAPDAEAHQCWIAQLADAILETYAFDERFSKGFVHKVSLGSRWSAAVVGDAAVMRGCIALGGGNPSFLDDLDADGSAPLHYAVLFGHIDVVGLLLEAGVRIDIADTSDFNTPLHIAAALHNVEMCNLLVANLAPIGATNLYGLTPLSHAMKVIENAEHAAVIIHWLLDKGADPCTPDADGCQPLAHAVEKHNVAIVSELILHGAFPNLLHSEGYAVLHVACGAGQTATEDGAVLPRTVDMPTLCTLLLHGASPNTLAGPKRETPLHVILRRWHTLKTTPSGAAAAIEIATCSSAASKLCSLGARLDIADSAGVLVSKLADDCGCKPALEAAWKGFGTVCAPPYAAELVSRLNKVCSISFRLSSAAELFGQLGHAAAPWGSDASPSCTYCSGSFTMFSRKHHCRHCGVLVCHSCSTKKFPLLPGADSDDDVKKAVMKAPSGQPSDLRVCDGCFNRLMHCIELVRVQSKKWEEEKAKALATAKNFADERAELLAGGKPSAAAGGPGSKMSEVQARLDETKERLALRGEKLSRIEDRTADMADAAKDFAAMAAQLRQQSKPTSWFGF